MLDWVNCISEARPGKPASGDLHRTHFQRDYDRLIFSSAFRRLQNKTQVFPLPGNTFVHNRLTHSLEVASVGRSLGAITGEMLAPLVAGSRAENFYKYDLSAVVAAACLAHDVGNPPFGHSGEKAISAYFIENEDKIVGDRKLRDWFQEKEWADLVNFEGNANAFHLLTYGYQGKADTGMQLTFTTLASILKYPCEASSVDKSSRHTKKYGFFHADRDRFLEVAAQTHMLPDESREGIVFKRHPFVYLVEAADDICYRIIDMEDAHRIGILTTAEVADAFLNTIRELTGDVKKIQQTLKSITDKNEKIAYLRAKCISALIQAAAESFSQNKEAILSGSWDNTLLEDAVISSPSLAAIDRLSIDRIYDHHSVIEVEIAGYRVMSEILATFVEAELAPKKSALQKKTLLLIPEQFRVPAGSTYERVLNIVDFIAGMTDGYATEMYRNFMGIEIKRHG
ncbi:MAG: dNTP triphosphohydrolase [Saprospiraceae bacterium]|nr:dNTP triphosphohydrolase [Saprospiraceae bacterium]